MDFAVHKESIGDDLTVNLYLPIQKSVNPKKTKLSYGFFFSVGSDRDEPAWLDSVWNESRISVDP